MYPSIDKVKAILVRENYISEDDSKKAEAAAQDTAGYLDFLINAELLDKTLFAQAMAEAYKIPYLDLVAHPAQKDAAILIPELTARTNHIVAVKASDKELTIAASAPDQIDAKSITSLFPGKKIHLVYAMPELIEASYSLYEKPLETRFSQIITAGRRVAPEIVDEIIKDALTYKASDIHFEPHPTDVLVRFRVDGSLRDAGHVPREYYENILNRIKVESGMRIDEHFAAQDGALRRELQSHMVDLRVSLVPTVEGEKIVMRVLGSYIQSYSLSDIGLDEKRLHILQAHAAKPFGMILTVGPTGSGKTTTLYSMIKLLNRPNVNITSIEDPVEYKVAGINQIQVREQAGVTFARGLRSIVRQDPDIILVGEIRDRETAEISVNAALTGHLLLSSFHSNDAATAIPRLIDMGIEPFLLASTLEVIVAQRLVRKICNTCRQSVPASEALKEVQTASPKLSRYFHATDTLYIGKGCNVCNGSGYLGRSALFEFIEITPEIQELILTSPSTREIETLARSQGSLSMFEDGVQKVKSGVTSLTEILRVVAPPTEKSS